APRYDDEQGDEQLTRDAGADTDARGDEDNNNNHDDRPPARGRGRGKGRDDSRDDRDHDRRRARGQMRDQEEESDDEAGDDQDMDRSKMSRFVKRRRYKIQEVIKKGQVILVQVVKDERGQKGAAMTSYLSLAGRYCVVMPNATKGGGISRKIGPAERDHLRSVMRSLNMPKGMGLIIRTAGADRSENEIKDDYNYVLHLWDHIRELTVASTAPVMIYEEGSLIKKAILNYNNSSIDEIWIEGHEAYSLAVDTMKSIAPQEVSKIKEYEPSEHKYKSIFHFHDIEYEIQAIYEPYVPLPSGGMLVINQTEALVAIDVNSGKAIKERNIEETALRTNMEAAAEVARQLRLRDLSGQIVIDFIDMEDNRNIYQVERFFREQLRKDRARVQVARIGMFGMLEMTRQRLRPSITETVMQECPHCHGTGRSFRPEYYSLQFLRELFGLVQEKGAGRVVAEVPPELAQDLLAHKKDKLEEIEHTYKVDLVFADLSPKSLEPYIINYSKGRGKTAAPKTSKAKKQVAPLDFTTTAGTEQEA
ncbi:MAG: Rne/Rng family ribonuclease, partial [Alphaproteobacteria bacterium]|nr:Rne/Rng family ribonuclease [Alphaproteobacteria bacterium]